MRSNGTFSEAVSGDVDHWVCADTTSCARDGTYEYTSDDLIFCDPECDEGMQYAISGDTITYVLVVDVFPFSVAPAGPLGGPLRHELPEGTVTYVIVFQRTSSAGDVT